MIAVGDSRRFIWINGGFKPRKTRKHKEMVGDGVGQAIGNLNAAAFAGNREFSGGLSLKWTYPNEGRFAGKMPISRHCNYFWLARHSTTTMTGGAP